MTCDELYYKIKDDFKEDFSDDLHYKFHKEAQKIKGEASPEQVDKVETLMAKFRKSRLPK